MSSRLSSADPGFRGWQTDAAISDEVMWSACEVECHQPVLSTTQPNKGPCQRRGPAAMPSVWGWSRICGNDNCDNKNDHNNSDCNVTQTGCSASWSSAAWNQKSSTLWVTPPAPSTVPGFESMGQNIGRWLFASVTRLATDFTVIPNTSHQVPAQKPDLFQIQKIPSKEKEQQWIPFQMYKLKKSFCVIAVHRRSTERTCFSVNEGKSSTMFPNRNVSCQPLDPDTCWWCAKILKHYFPPQDNFPSMSVALHKRHPQGCYPCPSWVLLPPPQVLGGSDVLGICSQIWFLWCDSPKTGQCSAWSSRVADKIFIRIHSEMFLSTTCMFPLLEKWAEQSQVECLRQSEISELGQLIIYNIFWNNTNVLRIQIRFSLSKVRGFQKPTTASNENHSRVLQGQCLPTFLQSFWLIGILFALFLIQKDGRLCETYIFMFPIKIWGEKCMLLVVQSGLPGWTDTTGGQGTKPFECVGQTSCSVCISALVFPANLSHCSDSDFGQYFSFPLKRELFRMRITHDTVARILVFGQKLHDAQHTT